jgi:hypothetical protein
MAIDANGVLGQAETANEELAGYFNDLNKYLTDDTGEVLPPDFQKVIDKLDYSELHRMTFVRVNDAASYENGAAIENVHQMVALSREFDMANKRKTDYYVDAGEESNRESDFYANMKVFWSSMLRGNYVEGATS